MHRAAKLQTVHTEAITGDPGPRSLDAGESGHGEIKGVDGIVAPPALSGHQWVEEYLPFTNPLQ